jgi:hypothetical protein
LSIAQNDRRVAPTAKPPSHGITSIANEACDVYILEAQTLLDSNASLRLHRMIAGENAALVGPMRVRDERSHTVGFDAAAAGHQCVLS